ncbi:hypothetical protein MKX03_007200 [Papaver bracteatum]|nr:hypothetical protein MKX03_007200 [Papaver bracteatum]
MGNGSQKYLKIYVVARLYAGELQILSKRLTCKFMFLYLRASKMCDVSSQRGIGLCLLHLGLWCIASGDAFTWIFTWQPEGHSSLFYSGNEYCYGWEEFLVEVVNIKVLLVLITGGVCFYGYLRWKFGLVPPGLWCVRSVTMTVRFSVFSFDKKMTSHSKSLGVAQVYIEVGWNSGNDNAGAHGSENSASIGLLSLCYARLIFCHGFSLA